MVIWLPLLSFFVSALLGLAAGSRRSFQRSPSKATKHVSESFGGPPAAGMGAGYSRNDYELVIKTSKELEYILEHHWGAQGKGLHEKLNYVQASGQPLPEGLVKDIRYIATIRNRLIHERGFDSVPDRPVFLDRFESAQVRLKQAIDAKTGSSSDSACALM